MSLFCSETGDAGREPDEDEDAIDGSAVAELQPDGNLTVRPRDSADPEATYPCPSNISKDEVKENGTAEEKADDKDGDAKMDDAPAAGDAPAEPAAAEGDVAMTEA